MDAMTRLEIRGYRNEPVPNMFWQQAAADRLAIVLPGYGYTTDMPVLYYPGQVFVQRGADLLQVQYAYNLNPEYRRTSDKEQADWLAADVTAACQAVLSRHAYRQVTLIGKSLGTMAMASLLQADQRFADAACIWLTPVLSSSQVVDRILVSGQKSLFAIGTADPFYKAETIGRVRQKEHFEVMVFPDANHSLEVQGDPLRSVKILSELVERIVVFAGG